MNRTNVFFFIFFRQTFTRVTVTASAIVSHYSKEKKTFFFLTSFFSLCRTHLTLTNIRGRCLVGGRGCRKPLSEASHTAFKRTCETACIVKSLGFKLDVLFHFISQSALNRSSHQQWMCWTESRCCCLAKVFFFFFLYILLYLFVCSVVVSSPPKTFEQLYMKCVVVALVVVFFFIWYHRLRADIMCSYSRFQKSISGFFPAFTFRKKTHQSHFVFFFLTRALKVWRSGSGRSWLYTYKLWSEVLVSFISRVHLLPVGEKKVIVSKWLSIET